MEVCYWALLFMPLVILHHLLNVFVQLPNKRGFTKKKKKLHLLSFYDDLANFELYIVNLFPSVDAGVAIGQNILVILR
jgi:hypothetical protein